MTATRSHISAITPQVVADQDHAHPEVALELEQQAQDLVLDDHVERGGRLVGEQHPRADASAIAISTRCRIPPLNWCG